MTRIVGLSSAAKFLALSLLALTLSACSAEPIVPLSQNEIIYASMTQRSMSVTLDTLKAGEKNAKTEAVRTEAKSLSETLKNQVAELDTWLNADAQAQNSSGSGINLNLSRLVHTTGTEYDRAWIQIVSQDLDEALTQTQPLLESKSSKARDFAQKFTETLKKAKTELSEIGSKLGVAVSADGSSQNQNPQQPPQHNPNPTKTSDRISPTQSSNN